MDEPAAEQRDLLVVGTLHTMDPERPRAEAALIRGGRFVRVGSRAECRAEAGARTEVLDLGRGSATPGLADAHGHLLCYGLALLDVDCTGTRSAEECAARAAERARATPPGEWVLGRGWDESAWPEGRLPDAAALSAAAPDHPVVLHRVDGHAAWLNARALARAGIGPATPDPPGGKIVRDAAGEPTGLLVDNALALLRGVVPPPSAARVEAALRRALAELPRVGLTSVHDPGVDAATLEVYAALAAADRLPLRVYAMLDGQAPVDVLVEQMARWRVTPRVGRLTVRAVKLFADGALGSRGARLFEPYADDPASTGLDVTPPDELRRRVLLVARAGYQPCVHAIGDRACYETLGHFLAAEQELPLAALRPRVEHLQVLRPSDVPLLRASGAVASMQPAHATSDGAWVEARLGSGTERLRGAYAWRRVLDARVPLAFGSDFPVEPPDPLRGLQAAETRDWLPEQRLTRAEALRAFTAGAAYAERAEARRGRIREGYDADLTAFDGDLLAVPAEALASLVMTYTVVGGRVAHAPGGGARLA
ncbi:MAG TPA: amidohydrolase [Chloroflexota bacterium]|nr:amidohydrolase [Chloroflexota bacterium]